MSSPASTLPTHSNPTPTSSFRLRPRFEHHLPEPPEVVRERLLGALAEQADVLEVKQFPDFIGVHIHGEERHRWSPRLHLSIDPDVGGQGTRVIGVFGPELEVWAFFLYGYVMCGLIGMFAAIFGFAQLFIGESAWGLWVTGGVAAIAGGLYLLAQLGQKFATEQTLRLRDAYRRALGATEGI